jgi:hypothetical protein
MTKRRKINSKLVKKLAPYVVTAVVTLGIASIGSINKQSTNTNLSLGAFAANDYNISVDQLSELYVVADLSDSLSLASASDVASN